jgi:hypothetical protein
MRTSASRGLGCLAGVWPCDCLRETSRPAHAKPGGSGWTSNPHSGGPWQLCSFVFVLLHPHPATSPAFVAESANFATGESNAFTSCLDFQSRNSAQPLKISTLLTEPSRRQRLSRPRLAPSPQLRAGSGQRPRKSSRLRELELCERRSEPASSSLASRDETRETTETSETVFFAVLKSRERR